MEQRCAVFAIRNRMWGVEIRVKIAERFFGYEKCLGDMTKIIPVAGKGKLWPYAASAFYRQI